MNKIKNLVGKTLRKISSVMNSDLAEKMDHVMAQNDRTNQRMNKLEKAAESLSRPSSQNLEKLEQALVKAEAYQPLYGLEGLDVGSSKISRPNSRERAETIWKALGPDIHGLRVVDVGSSLGYMSFYLADRGAAVEGWDFRAVNTNVANIVGEINKVQHATFKTRELTPEILKGIPPGRIDAVLILSVLHHTVMYNGLEYTQDLMKELLSRVPVVIVELAQKGEDKNLEWDASQPKDALAVFDKAKELGITIEQVGEFDTHLSGKTRPMYKISRDHLTVDNKNYAFDKLSRVAYQGASIPNPRTFYKGAEAFIKQYALTRSTRDQNKIQLVNEVNFYLSHGSHDSKIPNIPKMLAYEINDTDAYLVLETVEGALIDEANQVTLQMDIDQITKDMLDTLAALEAVNLYHNDVRSWNVIVNRNKVTLIDFGLVDSVERENNKIAFLWMLNAAITHERESTEQDKTELPPRGNFTYEHTLKIYDAIADNNDISFAELKQIK